MFNIIAYDTVASIFLIHGMLLEDHDYVETIPVNQCAIIKTTLPIAIKSKAGGFHYGF